MKDERTIKKWIKELEDVTEADQKPTLESRISYYAHHLLRRVVEDVVDWPMPAEDLKETVALIEREIENGTYERTNQQDNDRHRNK